MTASRCPFCGLDPFHYEDVGVGFAPVAVNCCDAGVDLYRGDKKAWQILELRRSPSPKKKARARRLWDEQGYEV